MEAIRKYQEVPKAREEQGALVLVYYNIRGKLQPIRNLVAYLGLRCVQLHLQEEGGNDEAADVRALLKGTPVDRARLPLLLHQGFRVYDSYPIMAYLCRRFGREELMGRGLQQRAQLVQIMSIYFMKQPSTLAELFVMAEECAGRSEQEAFRIRCAYLEKLMRYSGYAVENCRHLERHPHPGFILGDLTLIDFTFLETGHYILGFFGDLDSAIAKQVEVGALQPHRLPVSVQHLGCLEVIRKYLRFIKAEPFYLQHQEQLESKTIISFLFSPNCITGIRQIWMGTPSMVH